MRIEEFISFIVVGTVGLTIVLIIKNYQLKKQLKIQKNLHSHLKENNDFLNREIERLKKEFLILEQKDDNIFNNKHLQLEYNPIFAGMTALEGNYDKHSSDETKRILESFGMSVDVVRTGDAIIDKVENGCKYDIIFTNSIYQNGTNDGIGTLESLKQIDGFNTPVVIHSIYDYKKDYFMSKGFDEFLAKSLKPDEVKKVLQKLLNKKKSKVGALL